MHSSGQGGMSGARLPVCPCPGLGIWVGSAGCLLAQLDLSGLQKDSGTEPTALTATLAGPDTSKTPLGDVPKSPLT